MDELTKILVRRYADISFRLRNLKQEMEKLEDEKNRASVAAEAISLDLDAELRSKPDYIPPAFLNGIEEEDKNPEPEAVDPLTTLTIKEAAILILRDSSKGLTANQILEEMRIRFSMEYPRSSLSPQLSRLKADGQIELFAGKWMLPAFLPEHLRQGTQMGMIDQDMQK